MTLKIEYVDHETMQRLMAEMEEDDGCPCDVCQKERNMKTVPVQRTTVDMDSGEVTETKTVPFQLMPVPETACQVCGRDPAHSPDQPHDAQSLYYQYAFYGEHGRWPTWKDAVAHCSPETQQAWETELRRRGKWTEPA